MKKKSVRSINSSTKAVSHMPSKIQETQTIDSNIFANFNPESLLHSLGYKVGISGLSVQQRRNLLKKVIKTGMISKYEVIETLEGNISISSNNSRRVQAVKDWKADLDYVRQHL